MATLTAVNPTTGNQVTRYVYGSTICESAIARSDLLRAVIYPDSDDTSVWLGDGPDGIYDRVEYTYDRQGERVSMRDQNETLHMYDYDGLGRQVHDHGLAQDIVEAGGRDAVQPWQARLLKPDARMASPRLGQQAFGGVEARRRKPMIVQPGGVAAAAAADVGRRAAPEVFPDQGMHVRRRWLGLPVLGIGGGVLVVGLERQLIHSHPLSQACRVVA